MTTLVDTEPEARFSKVEAIKDLYSFRPILRISQARYRLLVLLCNGLSNKEIGDNLGITEQAVKNMVCEIYQRLGMHNNARGSSRLILGRWFLEIGQYLPSVSAELL